MTVSKNMFSCLPSLNIYVHAKVVKSGVLVLNSRSYRLFYILKQKIYLYVFTNSKLLGCQVSFQKFCEVSSVIFAKNLTSFPTKKENFMYLFCGLAVTFCMVVSF